MTLNILHCISGLSVHSGGTARAAPALANAVARLGYEVHLAYCSTDEDIDLHGNAAKGIPFRRSGLRVLGGSREMRGFLMERKYDIYHAQCIWQLPASYSARAARRHHAPYLVTPYGMLEPWALQRSRWKKRIVECLYQKRDLRLADCLHANTLAEVEGFRRYGLMNPSAAIPNGVDLNEFANLKSFKGRLGDLIPDTRNRPVALFLSRMHPKKGILHLLDAWASIRQDHPEWLLLLVCGPDEVGHKAEVDNKIKALGLMDSVVLSKPMYGEDKLAAMATAEFFVLPSLSEGFSMAVLEALACRLPVLITPGCNFPEVEKAGAGVIVGADAKGTEEGLQRLMFLSESERAAMGAKGRKLIEERYIWDRVGAQMVEVYEWLLGGGSPPECVIL